MDKKILSCILSMVFLIVLGTTSCAQNKNNEKDIERYIQLTSQLLWEVTKNPNTTPSEKVLKEIEDIESRLSQEDKEKAISKVESIIMERIFSDLSEKMDKTLKDFSEELEDINKNLEK